MTIERAFGKGEPQQIVFFADTEILFDSLGIQRTVVLETDDNQRVGIYTTALKPEENEQPLSLEDNLQPALIPPPDLEEITKLGSKEQHQLPVMTATELLDAMRFKQRVENQFFVSMHEMGSDALPTHTTYKTQVVQAYDLIETQKQLNNANKRLQKYATQQEQQEQLHKIGQLDKHQFNLLNKRIRRLQRQTEQEIESIIFEQDHIQLDDNDETVLLESTEVLDVRKLTLFNLFKLLGEGCFENTGRYFGAR